MPRQRNSHIQLQLCQLYFDKWSPDLSDSDCNKETISKPNYGKYALRIRENTLNKHICNIQTCSKSLSPKSKGQCHTQMIWNNDNDNVMQWSSMTPNLVQGSKVETSPRWERRDGIDVLVILGEWTASKGSTDGPSAQWHSARAITPKLCLAQQEWPTQVRLIEAVSVIFSQDKNCHLLPLTQEVEM